MSLGDWRESVTWELTRQAWERNDFAKPRPTVTLRLESGEVLARGLARDPGENIRDEERARDPDGFAQRERQAERWRARGLHLRIT